MAIVGYAKRKRRQGKGNHIITTNIEHPAVTNVCKYLETEEGFEITYLPVDASGRVDAQQVCQAIKKGTILITIMHANNEIGTVMPLREIVEKVRQREAEAGVERIAVHTDASQTIGKLVN